MRAVLAAAVLLVTACVATNARPGGPAALSGKVGQRIEIEGALHDCKPGPCIHATRTGSDVVVLRDGDARRLRWGNVRVVGVLDHDEGTDPAGCTQHDCDPDAIVPAHYFIRSPAIYPMPGLAALVDHDVVLEGRLAEGKNWNLISVGSEYVELEDVERIDFGQLVFAQAKVRVRGKLGFKAGTTCSFEAPECLDSTGVPPRFFIHRPRVEVID